MTKIRPLSRLQSLLYPLLYWLAKPGARELLDRRQKLSERIRERRRNQAEAARDLQKEARNYEQIIVNAWQRMGEAWISTRADLSNNGKSPHKPKVQRVRFSRIFATDEIVYFQIEINRRKYAGTKNMLPLGVYVAQLTAEETLLELSFATGRQVKADMGDPRKGAWILVYRLIGADGIPIQVRFKDVIEHYPQNTDLGTMILGVGEHRKVQMEHLAKLPHVLIAGSTQGGKSNLINCLICQFIRFVPASEMEIILIDLKRIEFGLYTGVPHLHGRPIVYTPEGAIEILDSLLLEFERRTKLLSESGAKEISEWNEAHPENRLRRVLVIIDEFAEVTIAQDADTRHTVHRLVTRIANLGRAVGIHLIVATQRPEVKVIPGSIRTNMPLIVSTHVPNNNQSMVILGDGSAAKLPVLPGRVIARAGESTILQTPHILKEDIAESIAIARGRAEGVIDLDGQEAYVLPDGLAVYIVDKLNGELGPGRLMNALRPLGVPARGLKAFLKELGDKRAWRAGDRVFYVRRSGPDAWRLVEPISESEYRRHFVRSTIWQLPAPAPLLMLAAPLIEEPATVEQPAPVFEPPTVQKYALTMSDDEIVDLFLKERCELGTRQIRTSVREVRTAYNQFCNELDEDILPLDKVKLSRALTQRGIESRQSNGVRYYHKIRLKAIENAQPESPGTPNSTEGLIAVHIEGVNAA